MNGFDIETKQAFLKASGYYEGDFSETFSPKQRADLHLFPLDGFLQTETVEFKNDIKMLSSFMQGVDGPTYCRMIGFFSVPGKYVFPREVWRFRNSMNDEEWADFKLDFWSHMVNSGQYAAAVI